MTLVESTIRPPAPRDTTYTNLFCILGILLWTLPFMRLKQMNFVFGPTQMPTSNDWHIFHSGYSREWSQAFLFVSVAV